MNEDVNVVRHDDPGSQLVQIQLPVSILEGIDNASRYPFIPEPQWTVGG
jgi:hypothetical protein